MKVLWVLFYLGDERGLGPMTMLPPLQYDHPPSIPVIEQVLGFNEVNRICTGLLGRDPPPGKTWWGCAKVKTLDSKNTCIVFRVPDEIVRRHELGHCNGWGPDHPTEEQLAKTRNIFLQSDWSKPATVPTSESKIVPKPAVVHTYQTCSTQFEKRFYGDGNCNEGNTNLGLKD